MLLVAKVAPYPNTTGFELMTGTVAVEEDGGGLGVAVTGTLHGLANVSTTLTVHQGFSCVDAASIGDPFTDAIM